MATTGGNLLQRTRCMCRLLVNLVKGVIDEIELVFQLSRLQI
jgi:hypothetical protein